MAVLGVWGGGSPSKVFLPYGLAVSICDIDVNVKPRLDERVLSTQILFDGTFIKDIPNIAADDVVMLAIPVDAFPEFCQALLPQLPDGCFVFDIASVKGFALKSMYDFSASRLCILSLHPLFGPIVSTPVGQIVIACGYDSDQAHHTWLFGILKHCGFILKRVSPEEHDEIMLYVQVLTHFTLMSFARVLSSSGKPLADLLQYRTPPFTFTTAFAGRVVGGTAQTYANIQRLPNANKIRDAFIEAARELDNGLDESRPLAESIAVIKDIVEPWRGHEVAECRSISATGASALQELEHRLFILCRSKTLCALQRLDKDEVHVGLVKRIEVDRILFEDISVAVHDKFAVCTNDIVGRTTKEKVLVLVNLRLMMLPKEIFVFFRSRNLATGELRTYCISMTTLTYLPHCLFRRISWRLGYHI